ncbi:hypothetical protein evm_013820 [Chilo suppressalis]|nr:hypothetical protein evm_013820 [Chilo suppressalis]
MRNEAILRSLTTGATCQTISRRRAWIPLKPTLPRVHREEVVRPSTPPDPVTCYNKTLSALKMSASNSDALWSDKCVNLERKLHDLTLALSKLEEDKHRRETEHQDLIKQERDRLSQDKLQWQSTLEKNFNAQLAKSQEHLNRKDKQIEDLNINCKQLRENIGHLETQLRICESNHSIALRPRLLDQTPEPR